MYSKLATIELCGWIEMSIDDLVERVLIRKTRPGEIRSSGTRALKQIHGFSFENGFRKALVGCIGAVGLEAVEAKISAMTRDRLKRNLDELIVERNKLAHTYLKGVTQTIEAPSVVTSRFEEVLIGLRAYETELRRLY
ncbi:hypothetical protein [Dinoroseobacter sp. S76]|uniref:hypothetical protein n=1 Tax=Dinoroseobacter sp. S76 TaxID=3415124 RepID=UPI003C7B47D4